MRNIPEQHLNAATWHKSSYSGGGGDDCLEVTPDFPTFVPIRDSKNPQGPKLIFGTPAWGAFVEDIKRSR
ncbi:DUF397 domain-containing protein [Streptomyces sp. NPDC006385]|uniref:DUF397 domain-containing protein n=1 Tax=Streptomyces sp. NPDC006385 TaxID=3156761 RepID=UPI0033BF34DA